jgi:hypothetical protein
LVEQWCTLHTPISGCRYGDIPQAVPVADGSTFVFLLQAQLQALARGEPVPAADVDKLKKRKMVVATSEKYHKLGKGSKFALQKAKLVTDLTQEMIVKGTWKSQTFKEYNFNALGQPPAGGHLHPLLKVRRAAKPKKPFSWGSPRSPAAVERWLVVCARACVLS